MADSDNPIIVGNTIIASTTEAANMLLPLPPNKILNVGTMSINPKNPYTIDGIPAN